MCSITKTRLIEQLINKYYDVGKIGIDYNHISMSIIEKYPDIWDYEKLSYKRDLSFDFVELQINKNWSWRTLSSHDKLDIFFLERHLDKPWCWVRLSSNQNITLEFIKKNINYPWNYHVMSSNINITQKFVEDNIEQDWNFSSLIIHKIVDWNFIEKYIYDMDNYYILSGRAPFYLIEKYFDDDEIVWSMQEISGRKDLSFYFVDKHIDKDWCWITLSRHCNINFDVVYKHKNKPWNIKGISSNTSITINDIIKYPDFNWDYKEIFNYMFDSRIINKYLRLWKEYVYLKKIVKIQRWWLHHCYSPCRKNFTNFACRNLYHAFSDTHNLKDILNEMN